MPPSLSLFAPYGLYIAGAIGAVGLFLLMRPAAARGQMPVRALGAIIGLAGFGLLVVEVLSRIPDVGGVPVFPTLLGLIAVAAATRMVTHNKPVFAALYFIMVVVSSAGLFLTLHAEFMAFALIIVYAGAILITYMFVLMLAQQTPSGGDVEGGTQYDRLPREPVPALAVGFIMLATLSDALFVQSPELRAEASSAQLADAARAQWTALELMPKRIEREVRRIEPATQAIQRGDGGRLLDVTADGRATVRVMVAGDNGSSQPRDVELPASAMPTNTQLVGLALVNSYPASLELASVILLMAMFGAVVLARKQAELGEDERRDAAGMRRMSLDDPDMSRGGRA
ncbi:MAG: NADH-quinone oxidoreductase subunit J [Phycisphaerae bacterium]|nr:NADH-quinone oxidoreductase subunit J [Phycisphaerae bacterium]